MTDRIIALIDMDCFYCQVEARINPSLKGKPMAVVQYNAWKGGGIIAVNYEARTFGVTRHIRGNDAKQKCPDIALVQVPELRGKADLTKYRDAGQEVVSVLTKFSDCVERASVDEAYIDLTQAVDDYIQSMENTVSLDQLHNTFVVGFSEEGNNDEEYRLKGLKSWLADQMVDPNDLRLAVGGVIVEQVRAAIHQQTEFRCSAGIAHNKVMSKLVCGMHKPNRQTILPHAAVAELYRTLSIKKVRHLGGKLGDTILEKLGCKVMADLQQFTEVQLQQHFDVKNGSWLYNIARGIDNEPVTARLLSKSIGCSKNFPGKQALTSRASVEKWLLDLAKEMQQRLIKDQEENERRAKLLVVSFCLDDTSSSRSTPINSYEPQRIMEDAIDLIKKTNGDKWSTPIKHLGLCAGKFVDASSAQNSIQNFFKSVEKLPPPDDQEKCYRPSTDTVQESIIRNEKSIKETKNSSFFKNYFIKQSVSGVLVSDDNLKISIPSGSKDIASMPLYDCNSSSSNDCDDLRNCQLPVPTSVVSNAFPNKMVPSDDSNSSDDGMFISPGEIFPDPCDVDDSIAALLPSSMRIKLQARRQEKAKHQQTTPLHHLAESNEVQNLGIISRYGDEVENGRANLSDAESCNSTKETRGNLSILVKDSIRMLSSVSKLSTYGSSKPNLDHDDSSDSTDVDEGRLHCAQQVNSGNLSMKKKIQPNTDVNHDDTIAQIHTEDKDDDIPGQCCDKCLKYIPLYEYLEHLDFHAAEELHQQLNNSPVISSPGLKKPYSPIKKSSPLKKSQTLPRKRGRPSKNSVKPSVSDKKLRTITSFFTSNTR